jgi:CubicO group peptidase (beta-lactamase class C family)
MYNNGQLLRSTPEEQGISSSAILDFINATEKTKSGLHSFMLLRHGFVIAEGWWSPYSKELPHMLFSLSKSFTSTAIGLAVEEKLISTEDKVISFFGYKLPEKIDKNLEQMTIKDLLIMGTGHAEDTTDTIVRAEDGDWVKAFLSLPVEYTPGTHFLYNTGATYMLSAILQKVTGETLLDYLTPRLFMPLGIENATWDKCPKGINTGGFGLSIKTEDIAKFGQLYLQKGIYNGNRIVPEAWIAEATSKQISNGTNENSDWEQGYGYQFWRCLHNEYRGDGAFGQFCIVMPDKDVVLAVTSGSDDMGIILKHAWDNLLPAFEDELIDANSEAYTALKNKLRVLHIPAPQAGYYSNLKDDISGNGYELEKNEFKFEKVSFDFSGEGSVVSFTDARGIHKISCANEWWLNGKTDILGENSKIYASGTWEKNDLYVMSWIFVETPFCYTIKCNFSGNRIKVEIEANVSMGPKTLPELNGRLISRDGY